MARVLKPKKIAVQTRPPRVWPRVLWALAVKSWGRVPSIGAGALPLRFVAAILWRIPVRPVVILGLAAMLWFRGMPQPIFDQAPLWGTTMHCAYMGWDLELRFEQSEARCAWVRFEPIPEQIWRDLGLAPWRRAYS